MKGHDTRRTGQSKINGPREITQTWVTDLPAAHVVNIGATVTNSGVFFGSWGLLRNDSLGRDVRFWDKSDGKLYGLNPNTGESLWGGPLDLDVTHRCYEFDGRERTGTDVFFCGFSPYIASFYNGTVEGQPAVDIERNVLYVGRGDGKLYAIDPDAGRIKWRYLTFNPELPEDPDGGGEIISSPVIGPGGTIYCGTWGIGPYETNAFYAINPDSSLQWRFPSDSSLTDRPIFVSPAISPDQSTIYFGTFFPGDADNPGKLYALNLQPESSVPDEQRLKWDLELINDSKPVWTTTLAVGSDGIVYVGGLFIDGIVNRPVVFAAEDNGAPQLKWSSPFVSLHDGAQWIGGIALRESEGQTVRLYVATTNFRNNNNKEGRDRFMR
jgi:outer membrane protein assembly factor BamB